MCGALEISGGWCVADCESHWLLVLVALCFGCGANSAEQEIGEVQQRVVYGTDDRQEVYADAAGLLGGIARNSTLALIPNRWMKRQADGTWAVEAQSAELRYDLCENEPFAQQPAAADCSGTLIAKDQVLTAAHCVWSISKCRTVAFTFNYWYSAPGELATIDDDDIYQCQDVVFRGTDESADEAIDLAIVKLDRPVRGFEPVDLLPSEGLSARMAVVLVGAPAGVPIKIDRGGSVASLIGDPPIGFKSNLDAFLGSSGSGVYSESGLLVGVLSKGQRDYELAGDCHRARRLDDEVGDETVYFASVAMSRVCADRERSEEGCATTREDDEPSSGFAVEPVQVDEGVPTRGAQASGCSISSRSASFEFGLALWLAGALWRLCFRWSRSRDKPNEALPGPNRYPSVPQPARNSPSVAPSRCLV